MRLRNFLGRRRAPAAAESLPVAAAPKEPEEMTPAQLAELEEAWAELRQVAQEAGVKSFQACTRDGSRWQDNPVSVRAMTLTIKGIQKDTAESPKDL